MLVWADSQGILHHRCQYIGGLSESCRARVQEQKWLTNKLQRECREKLTAHIFLGVFLGGSSRGTGGSAAVFLCTLSASSAIVALAVGNSLPPVPAFTTQGNNK